VELNFNLVPNIVKNSCQNLLINMGLRSLMIDFGMSWILMMCFTNCLATIFAENG